MASCQNLLTVVGASAQVQRFQDSHWERALKARHCELMRNSAQRFACQFVTESQPLEALSRLSRRWPELVFLMEFDLETSRIKGLGKAKAGKLDHSAISY